MRNWKVSVVVPVYRGEPYLARLIDRLGQLREQLAGSGCELLEVIFVVDGARDRSGDILREAADQLDWVRSLTLSRNFGQHPATVAGILHSRGDWIVTMDEDLQHPPERIPDLLDVALRETSDIVYAKPTTQIHESALRGWTSRASKRLFALACGIPEAENFNSFRLVRGEIARAAADICGGDLYLDAALMWFTNRVSTCPMALADPREADGNRSSYTWSSLFAHAARLMFSARLRILRLSGLAGVLAMLFSLGYFLYILLRKLLYPEAIPVSGWTSQMLVTLLIGGTLLFMLSILLEYITLIFLRVQGKPAYFTIERERSPAAGEGD